MIDPFRAESAEIKPLVRVYTNVKRFKPQSSVNKKLSGPPKLEKAVYRSEGK